MILGSFIMIWAICSIFFAVIFCFWGDYWILTHWTDFEMEENKFERLKRPFWFLVFTPFSIIMAICELPLP